MKQKIIKRLIIVLLITILILGGIFAYLYFGTDILKTNEQLFFKYLGQMVDTQEGFIDTQLIEYSNKKYTGKYEDSGNFSIDVDMTGMDSQMLQTINDFNIEYAGKIDNTARKNEQDISINYSSDVNFPIKYKYANETLGLQTDYVSQKYIGIENRNLKEFAENLGITDTESIPDTIDLFSRLNNQETVNFTEEERKQVIHTYKTMIQEKLTGKEFTKTQENEVTSYSVQMTNQEIQDLMVTFLETLKNDQIMMSKMEEMFKEALDSMNQNSTEKITIQTMIQEMIDDMYDSEIGEGSTTITVSQINRKVSAIALTSTEETTEVEVKLTKTKDQGNLNYGIEMNITDVETQENMKYFLTASYQGLEQLASVNETYQYGITGMIDGQEQKMICNLNCTDTFHDGIIIEDYTEDEIQVLNEYNQEELLTLIMTIAERISEVNAMQMEEIGFSEYGNPIMFAFPLTSLPILMYNQASDVVNETSMSGVEIFNSQFTQYEGEQRGTDIKSLLQMVLSNNMVETDENRKVEVSGVVTMTKDDIEAPISEINSGSMYNVEIQYTEGMVHEIIITEQ